MAWICDFPKLVIFCGFTILLNFHYLHLFRPLGCIIEAILVHGPPCPEEYIINFLEARWKSLKHEGATDPRSATVEQLQADSTTPPILFEQARHKPHRWLLATSKASSSTQPHRVARAMVLDGFMDDDSLSDSGRRGGRDQPAVSTRTTRARRNKRKREEGFEATSSEDDFPTELPGGRDAAYLLDLPRKKPKVYTPEELSYDASTIPAEELLDRVKESKLTNLQILISISIIRSPNYEARLDYILDFVCQHYTYLLGRDGNPKATDPKRAVLASLSKNASSSPLFVKINDVWRIGPKNVLYGSKEVIPGLMEYITISKAPGDAIELTELQKMIMRAISLEGGTCGLERIYEYVKPRYDRLKRRDGSSYATNARRAIQASLSNNSSNRPIFQLVGTNTDEETLWSLTERGQESLDLINTNEPEMPFDGDSSFSDEPIPSPPRHLEAPDFMDLAHAASSSEAVATSSAAPSAATASSSVESSFLNSAASFRAASQMVPSGSRSPSSITSADGAPSDSEDESAKNLHAIGTDNVTPIAL